MNKTVTLIAFRDEMTGELGLGVKGIDTTDEALNSATEGLVIAHDLLEHVNGLEAIGSIDDELEALGGIWFVRGQNGELRRDHIGSAWTIHENIAGDLQRMFRDYFYGAPVDTTPRRTRPIDCDEELREIIFAAEHGRMNCLSEIDDEDRTEAQKLIKPYLAAALARMRTGYRKASRRFHGSALTAYDLFWAIAEAVQPYCKHVEYEGQRFTLTYGLRASTGVPYAFCDEDYGDDNDY
jgi:hypothetical protein